jgi:hypothetical protein
VIKSTCQISFAYDIRRYAYIIILRGQILKLTVNEVRGCYSSDIDHRDPIFTVDIGVFRLYCIVVMHVLRPSRNVFS